MSQFGDVVQGSIKMSTIKGTNIETGGNTYKSLIVL